MTFTAANEDKVDYPCTFPGCSDVIARSNADGYYSRRLPEGWVSVMAGYRCALHHDFEITFEEAISSVEADQGTVTAEFGWYEGVGLDNEAVIRALRRGPDSMPK